MDGRGRNWRQPAQRGDKPGDQVANNQKRGGPNDRGQGGNWNRGRNWNRDANAVRNQDAPNEGAAVAVAVAVASFPAAPAPVAASSTFVFSAVAPSFVPSSAAAAPEFVPSSAAPIFAMNEAGSCVQVGLAHLPEGAFFLGFGNTPCQCGGAEEGMGQVPLVCTGQHVEPENVNAGDGGSESSGTVVPEGEAEVEKGVVEGVEGAADEEVDVPVTPPKDDDSLDKAMVHIVDSIRERVDVVPRVPRLDASVVKEVLGF